MAFITREDGQHFVIPSYRDVISAKQKSVIKKDIIALSKNYGDYITLQKKSATQYEVAFSPDTGYLLGETVWYHFTRPEDMIYCEAIPNTTEAILVIVKNGSVYLDGRFPIESITEELVIFLTQQNNFEIYTYGDVPVVEKPEEGKFCFDASSVKSFTILDKPVFPTLPLLKIYQLQLVEVLLREQGIGVLPLKQLVIVLVVLFGGWFIWSKMTAVKVEAPTIVVPQQEDPYKGYYETLQSPDPSHEINQLMDQINLLAELPAWTVGSIDYAKGNVQANVTSNGGTVTSMMRWCIINKVKPIINEKGIILSTDLTLKNRQKPKQIYPLDQVIAVLVDKVNLVLPGNVLKLSNFLSKGVYRSVDVEISLDNVAPMQMQMISEQLSNLPVELKKVSLTFDENFSGTINLNAVGS